MAEGEALPLAIAVHIPALAARMGVGFLRFLGKRRSGVRAFRTALLAGGMDPAHADRLAAEYHEAGSIAKILRRTRIPWIR